MFFKCWQKSANKPEYRGLVGYRTCEWKKEVKKMAIIY